MRHNAGIGLLTSGALAAVYLGLVGCGLTSAHSGGGSGASDDSPAGATPRSTPSPGQVTVAVDKAQYAPSDTITVTITNGLAMTIATTDHQTNCTIVTLERLDNGQWRPEGMCRLMTPTRVVPISPGAATQPLSVTAWPRGTYRAVFRYFTRADDTLTPGTVPSEGAEVYSAAFAIN